MNAVFSRLLACLFTVAISATIVAQSPVRFPDLAGWWSADPIRSGEPSHVALQFLEKDGKQQGRLWLMAIGAYDIPLGTVTRSGNSIDFKTDRFPLIWNPTTQMLSGHLPADVAPACNISIEFRRSEPVEEPPARDWKDLPSEETVQAKKNWGFGASPVTSDGAAYAADFNGRAYAFDLN